MKAKTLVLTENFPPLSGGSGRWFWELYSRLPRDEYIIVANKTAESDAFDKTHDLNVIRIPLQSIEWGLKSITGLKFYWQCLKALKQIIKQHKITHIHCGRVIHEGITAWLLSYITPIQYLCYVHGEDVETAATSREHNWLVKQVCLKSQLLICNSQNSADIVKKLHYSDNQKIQVLHPGVNANLFIPANQDNHFKQQLGWEDKFIIITVGRLQKRKGQDMMIKAMPEILKQHPNALYAIIGRGECKTELKDLINELNLSDSVQLLDEISDEQMIQCYQQCDLFILPNRTIKNDIEGFGMVLVEAQACAKTVIAGDSGGTKETMLVEQTGYIIDCTQTLAISTTINQLIANPDKLDEMGKQGRLHVEQTLDWQAHALKAKDIFRHL